MSQVKISGSYIQRSEPQKSQEELANQEAIRVTLKKLAPFVDGNPLAISPENTRWTPKRNPNSI